jgi:hypothetical protein
MTTHLGIKTWIITKGKGLYVSEPGSKKSYTNRKDRSRKFWTYDDAKADCCGNEWPVEL